MEDDSKLYGKTKPFNEKKHPYTNAGIISKLLFTWLLPLFHKGYYRDLTEDDLFPPLKEYDSTKLGNRLQEEWEKELATKKDPSLWWALIRVFWKEMVALGVCYFCIETFIKLSQPISLSKLLEYYEPNSQMSKTDAYMYSCFIILTSLLPVLFQHMYILHQFLLGRKIKIATSVLVYRKALRLNKSALADTTIGQMVNLISNDVGRFESATKHIHDLWVTPIELAVVLILLYFYVGLTGLVGIILLLCYFPLQMFMSNKTSKYRLRTAFRTDERIRLMNEIVTGIQVIKMYTWEKPFAKLVEISRKKEIDQIKKTSIIRALIKSVSIFLTRTSIYSCILVYVLTGNAINAQYVYVITSFYGILQKSVTNRYPQGAIQFAEAKISVGRLKTFLLHPEVEFDCSGIVVADRVVGVYLKDISVKWSPILEDNSLKNISMEVSSNELAIIIGPVGSGKSTLLHAILKELTPTSGCIQINGFISYASQEPWLFAGSVKQNILFGQEFNERKYHDVIKVCALERDLQLFPYGDKTIVGERGVSLSGGQRARINLARAVYKDADIYLLDDPLSAVDTNVGKHIFEQCVKEYLKNKCVILVTHQLQYLKDSKKIYVLSEGRLEKSGTYEEIVKSGGEFTKFLSSPHDDDNGIETAQPTQAIRKRKESKEMTKVDRGPDIVKEGRGTGKIKSEVYKSYFRSGGGNLKILALFASFVVSQTICSVSEYYATFWVNMEQLKSQNESQISTFWSENMSEDVLLSLYSFIILMVIIITISRSLFFYNFCMEASTLLHKNMFDKIVYATMRFFNTNPSGRILNRFSMDMNQVDEVLPLTLLDTLQTGLNVMAITVMVASINPWMLLATAIILTIFYFLRVIYISTSRDIKRLEGITRSPVYSHLTASLQGLTTIRAFEAQNVLEKEFDYYQNQNTSAYFTFQALGRCFGLWLDLHCVLFITLVTLSFLLFDTKTLGGSVGLSITQAVTLTGMFQWGMRQCSELENQMTCVERIKEYADVVPESDSSCKEPAQDWPAEGSLVFKDLSLTYAPGQPRVLKNLNFAIKSTEKVGIVGRTGAGKSSIIAALFRLSQIEGIILIDGVDTKTVSLKKLRSSISIIPQEPVLFSGTLRKNLDPFDEYTDELLWNALDEVELKGVVSDLPQGLVSWISEGGSNFSVGQRQLLCLARAIVKNNKILVLDEATANVDPHTDSLIQFTVRRKFSNCTVLTIAHRLHTIMDSDKVIVMDAGVVVEFDHPRHLVQNANGYFYQMVQQTGKAMAENLINMIENCSLER